METILIRIIEKFFIIYFVVYFLIDIILFIVFLISFKSDKKKYEIKTELNEFFPKASIIVPAFNEEVSIVQCINMLNSLDYPEFEIIIVNDGSKDNTIKNLLNKFGFKISEIRFEHPLKTSAIKSIYITDNEKIILIDKTNGGKADAINAGINFSSGQFICTIDADSILDKGSLKTVVMPMIIDKRVFASGGQLAVSNETVIEDNRIVNFKMPTNFWVLWQITEYIKSFLISRLGLSKINSLLIMSGAFSVYRREDLLNAGGFLTPRNNHKYIRKIFDSAKSTVCEDVEIIVRLWRYYHEHNKKGRIIYLPKPLCWTEVPDNLKNLYKQRTRWHLGLAECLFMHGKMLFDPAYYTTGLVAYPYYVFFELLSPVIKLLSLAFLLLVSIQGLMNTKWVLLMILLITIITALVTSISTVFIERWSEQQALRNREALRYKTFGDWVKLLAASIIGEYTYSFFKIFVQFKGLLDFVRERSEWNKFERRGIKGVFTSSSEIN